MKIKGLDFQPYISDEEFFNRKKYRGDRWIIKIPEITAHQIDFINFFNENIITADSLIIPPAGRRTFNLLVIVKCFILQSIYNLSDPRLEEEIVRLRRIEASKYFLILTVQTQSLMKQQYADTESYLPH